MSNKLNITISKSTSTCTNHYVTVNFDIVHVCAATAIKELCQARYMGDTHLFNRQELIIMINTLCKQ